MEIKLCENTMEIPVERGASQTVNISPKLFINVLENTVKTWRDIRVHPTLQQN